MNGALAALMGACADEMQRRAAAASSFDPLGAELYLWAEDDSDLTFSSGTTISEWANRGTEGTDLDLLANTGTVSWAAGAASSVTTGVYYDGSSRLQSRAIASALSIPDGTSFDVIAVFSQGSSGLRALVGGESGAHWRLAPRVGGNSQWVINDGTTTSNELGASLSTATLYSMRGNVVGAASPSNDVTVMRVNDTDSTPSNVNLGAVTVTTRLDTGIVTGTAFEGYLKALIAKVGGFSSGEKSTLTSRINSAFGLSLASV